MSGLSNSPTEDGGQRCAVCHSNPPDDAATKGSHSKHGFTQTDCSKCHGVEADSFDLDHADGATKIAWNNPRFGYTNTAVAPAILADNNVVYTGTYTDATGAGNSNSQLWLTHT